MSADPIHAALSYAERGFAVLPVCWPTEDGRCGVVAEGREDSRHLAPKHKVGKVPLAGGANTATIDPAAIRRWWARWPSANVAISLAGLLLVDPDSPEAEMEAQDLGLPAGAWVRRSRNVAYLYRRPERCPATTVTKWGESRALDIMAAGYVVVHGRHVTGVDVYLQDATANPAEAPAWAVQALVDAEARRSAVAVERTKDEPLVRLSETGLRLWRGELVVEAGKLVAADKAKALDRSATLFRIALSLLEAGATRPTIIDGVANRDAALYAKYTVRRDNGRQEYERMADKVLAQTNGHEAGELPGFNLTPLTDLLAEPPESRRWLWDQTFPAAGVSIIAAKPKVGKSTLARNLALRVARGEPLLGRTTTKGAIVYLALEEKRAEIADHFRRMGAGANDREIHIHVGQAPQEALAALAAAIQATGAQLAIVDPLFRLIRLADVNDYASVTNAFEPLVALARNTGCHISCLHHLGKGQREAGDAVLGSTAIFAAVDTVITMRKRDPLRVVSSIQRYGKDLPETTLGFDVATGIVSDGGLLEHAVLVDAAERVLSAVESASLSETEIRDAVDGDNAAIGKALRALWRMGWLTREGDGKRGHPYRYSLSEDTAHGDATERGTKILAFLAQTYGSSEKASNNLVAISPAGTPRIHASTTTGGNSA